MAAATIVVATGGYWRSNSEVRKEKKGGFVEARIPCPTDLSDVEQITLFLGSEKFPDLHSNLLYISLPDGRPKKKGCGEERTMEAAAWYIRLIRADKEGQQQPRFEVDLANHQYLPDPAPLKAENFFDGNELVLGSKRHNNCSLQVTVVKPLSKGTNGRPNLDSASIEQVLENRIATGGEVTLDNGEDDMSMALEYFKDGKEINEGHLVVIFQTRLGGPAFTTACLRSAKFHNTHRYDFLIRDEEISTDTQPFLKSMTLNFDRFNLPKEVKGAELVEFLDGEGQPVAGIDVVKVDRCDEKTYRIFLLVSDQVQLNGGRLFLRFGLVINKYVYFSEDKPVKVIGGKHTEWCRKFAAISRNLSDFRRIDGGLDDLAEFLTLNALGHFDADCEICDSAEKVVKAYLEIVQGTKKRKMSERSGNGKGNATLSPVKRRKSSKKSNASSSPGSATCSPLTSPSSLVMSTVSQMTSSTSHHSSSPQQSQESEIFSSSDANLPTLPENYMPEDLPDLTAEDPAALADFLKVPAAAVEPMTSGQDLGSLMALQPVLLEDVEFATTAAACPLQESFQQLVNPCGNSQAGINQIDGAGGGSNLGGSPQTIDDPIVAARDDFTESIGGATVSFDQLLDGLDAPSNLTTPTWEPGYLSGTGNEFARMEEIGSTIDLEDLGSLAFQCNSLPFDRDEAVPAAAEAVSPLEGIRRVRRSARDFLAIEEDVATGDFLAIEEDVATGDSPAPLRQNVAQGRRVDRPLAQLRGYAFHEERYAEPDDVTDYDVTEDESDVIGTAQFAADGGGTPTDRISGLLVAQGAPDDVIEPRPWVAQVGSGDVTEEVGFHSLLTNTTRRSGKHSLPNGLN